MIDVSFIIVSWNAKSFLLNCLRSLEETAVDLRKEIIVVDNASTDGSPEAVRTEFPGVKVISNPGNFGFARANNIGIRQSAGRYLCLVNSDVVVLPQCVQNLSGYMERNSGVGMVGPRILNADKGLQPSCRFFPSYVNTIWRAFAVDTLFAQNPLFCGGFMTWWGHDAERKVDALSGCFWFVRRQAVEQVGGLDETFFIYAEDVDWCKRFHDAGWDVMFYPGAEAIHFGKASSSNAPVRYYVELHKAMAQYWRKHHGKTGKIFFLAASTCSELLRIIPRGISLFVFRKNDDKTLYKYNRSKACISHMLDTIFSYF